MRTIQKVLIELNDEKSRKNTALGFGLWPEIFLQIGHFQVFNAKVP
jgi:hypothetical protein